MKSLIVKGIGIFVIWLIASNSYYGKVDEKGEIVTDVNVILNVQENAGNNANVTEIEHIND